MKLKYHTKCDRPYNSLIFNRKLKQLIINSMRQFNAGIGSQTCSVSTKFATCPSSFVPLTLNRVPALSQLSLDIKQALA